MMHTYLFSFLIALSALAVVDADAATPVGGANAHIKGVFGKPFPWPVNAIHVTLLPNGKLYSYGPRTGPLSAALWHDVWDPKLGTGDSAHELLPNSTLTNTFCSAQALLPNSGQLLIASGDTTVNGKVNNGSADTNLFDYTATTNQLSSVQPMAYARWYPTLVPRSSGHMLVLGGRRATSPSVYASTPEVYTPEGPDKGWRTLTAAKNELAYGSSYGSWYYPRAWPAPNGDVFILAHHGEMFYLNPTGTGSITRLTNPLVYKSSFSLPSVQYKPGEIFSIRADRKVAIVNLNMKPPTVKYTAPISSKRPWSNATVCATGEVVVTGGSGVGNTLTDVTYRAEIWKPATGTWTLGAAAQKPRLYHSSAVCMPDATILTMGGGNPGPVTNLNAEVYYPGYLYKPGGSVASRPSIVSAPGAVVLGGTFFVGVESGISIDRVTLVRSPAVTHAFDPGTSFMALNFTQSGGTLTVTAPLNANVAMPGYWMMFVINQNGVPSVAKIVHLRTA